MSLLVPGNNFNWGRRFDRFSKLNWQPPPPLWPIWPPRWLSATVRSLISRVLYEICIYTHTHTHACWVCVCMFIRLSMSMNESSSKLRIKVYYFLFGSLLFSADLYNNFFTHLSPPSDHVPPPSLLSKAVVWLFKNCGVAAVWISARSAQKFQATQFYGNCCLLSEYLSPSLPLLLYLSLSSCVYFPSYYI